MLSGEETSEENILCNEIIEMSDIQISSTRFSIRNLNSNHVNSTPSERNRPRPGNSHTNTHFVNAIRNDNESDCEERSSLLCGQGAVLRCTAISPTSLEDQANNIVDKFKHKSKFMKNDPEADLMRLQVIKNMPQGLTLKRSVKAKLSLSVSQKSKKRTIGFCKRLKYDLSMRISKTRTVLHEMCSSLQLWYHPIKKIEGHFGSGVATYFKFLRWLFAINFIGCFLSIVFIILPQMTETVYDSNQKFSYLDLLLGNGFFTKSILYYGFYSNDTLVVHSGYTYHMPTAYFLTMLFSYVFTFIFLFFKVIHSYRVRYIETSIGAHNRYAKKIFCSWDWAISSQKAASLRSTSIYRELSELLSEDYTCDAPLSFHLWFWTILIRISMTTLLFITVIGIGILLWLLLDEHYADYDESNNLQLLKIPIIMTIIMNILPPLISWSVNFERYAKDRISFYVTMTRAYFITAVAVAILIIFCVTRAFYSECWQTYLAQEIYRLIILDFLVSVIGSFTLQGIRAKLLPKSRFGIPNFNIAHSTLSLIYNQSLFWMAHYYSPPLSLVIVIKLFLTFYIKKCELLNFCEPSQKFWLALQTQTLFLALTFFGLISAMAVISYSIIYVSSGNCGPFLSSEYTWEIIVDKILNINRNSTLWTILGHLSTPATGIILLISLSFAVYYLKAKAEASKKMVAILREMLVWQARDKEFLLKNFAKVAEKNGLRHRNCSKVVADVDSHRHNLQINEPSTSY